MQRSGEDRLERTKRVEVEGDRASLYMGASNGRML